MNILLNENYLNSCILSYLMTLPFKRIVNKSINILEYKTDRKCLLSHVNFNLISTDET